jgi:hypothetical protein
MQLMSSETNFDPQDKHSNKSCLSSNAQADNFGNSTCNVCECEKKIQTEWHEMETNTFKDRAIHEGHDPLFLG